MHIDIAGRMRPFSHLPGTHFMLPLSALSVQVFPTRLVFKDVTGAQRAPLAVIAFDINGPVDAFTAMQDLEKMQLRVWGQSREGFFRYRIAVTPSGDGVDIVAEKGAIAPEFRAGECTLVGDPAEQRYRLAFNALSPDLFAARLPQERLSLGGHKALNVDMLRQRLDFFEILPLWQRLGGAMPAVKEQAAEGTLALLQEAAHRIPHTAPEHLLKAFRNLFVAGFDNWLVPRLADTDFNGLAPDPAAGPADLSPLPLLTQGASLIRSLWLQHSDAAIRLLPALPVELHCGRFINAACGELGVISMEWSKKAVRRVTLQALKSTRIIIVCAKGEQTCRLRLGNKDRGVTYQIGAPLDIVAGQNYWFDNFRR